MKDKRNIEFAVKEIKLYIYLMKGEKPIEGKTLLEMYEIMERKFYKKDNAIFVYLYHKKTYESDGADYEMDRTGKF